MRRAVLLGSPNTKRTAYLIKAAEQTGTALGFLNWEDWNGQLPEGELFLKIDPPLWTSYALGQLETLTEAYRKQLAEIGRLAKKRNVDFFNTPSAIMTLLDKRICKERLVRAGLPVTEQLCGQDGADDFPDTGFCPDTCRNQAADINDTEQLLELMRRRNVCQVFIKPVSGSGAAGVSAFRIHPGTGQMSLYTCACEKFDEGLINTKKLHRYMDTGEVTKILDRLLELNCIVERWYPKAAHGGYTYDLRVVVQERRVDYILARLSKGPVTNLHLNNHPLPVEELGLPVQTRESVEELCKKAVDGFPGLWSAGIDLLLEKGSLRPRIIEMNAQGDLIYQDIYHENVIYRRQAEWMKKWLSFAEGSGQKYEQENMDE